MHPVSVRLTLCLLVLQTLSKPCWKQQRSPRKPFDVSLSRSCSELFELTAMGIRIAAKMPNYSYSKPPDRQLLCLGLAVETS